MLSVPLQANNRIWLTYRHFPYKAWNALAELVDNSTQSYLDNRSALDPALERDADSFSVRVHFQRGHMLSIVDNALGMDLPDLRRAVQLAAPPPDTSGRGEFGMGMKTSCCWLGDTWKIITKKLGSELEYTITIDVESIAASDAHDLPVGEKRAGADEHYTRIEITNLHGRLPGRTLGKTKSYLVDMFRSDIMSKDLTLEWDGVRLQPEVIHPLVTDEHGVEQVWRKDVGFQVGDKPVSGWICILGKGGRARAGFDLFRRGRVILGRPLGYRPHAIFGEQRNDLINQRLYGQLALDDFPVNHLKDDFLWDGLEDEFETKLREQALDYIEFARNYRSKQAGAAVSPPVVQATNDELAQELSEAQMLERLTIAEVGTVEPDPDEAIIEAKAELLRAQKIEPRIVEVGHFTFRIYHPEGMPGSDKYFVRQSAQRGQIDIFLNDNHPYVLEVTDESDYLMFARMCVVDAIVEHFMVHHQADIGPTFPAKLKDNLLRGFNV